jgi:hypothetical protein
MWCHVSELILKLVKKIGKYVMLLSSTQLYYDRFVTKIIFGKEYVDKLCFITYLPIFFTMSHCFLIFLDFTNEGLLLDHKGLIFLDFKLRKIRPLWSSNSPSWVKSRKIRPLWSSNSPSLVKSRKIRPLWSQRSNLPWFYSWRTIAWSQRSNLP